MTGVKPAVKPLLEIIKNAAKLACEAAGVAAAKEATLSDCLNACEGGEALKRAFCNRLANAEHKAMCWAAINESKQYCINTCHAIFTN